MNTLLARFNAKAVRRDGCWGWNGSRDDRGYGRIATNTSTGYRPIPASRASWILHFGEIPAGRIVAHRCDNPECANPEHLFLATMKENTQDMLAKGRCRAGLYLARRATCKNGHPFSGDNLFVKDGIRRCRNCAVNFTAAYKARKRRRPPNATEPEAA